MIKALLTLTFSFGKIGIVSLGGGNAMLKLIEYEAVQNYHWVKPEEFTQMVGTSFLFPGLTAIKLTALIGYKVGGLAGLVLTLLAINLPGLVLAFVGYQWLVNHAQYPWTRKLLTVVEYGAIALLAAATVSIAQSVLAYSPSLRLEIAGVLFFLSLVLFNISPFWGFMVFIGISLCLIK